MPKLTALRDLKKRYDSHCLLEIDGGIKAENIGDAVSAGADVVVSGSGVFAQDDYADVIGRMKAV